MAASVFDVTKREQMCCTWHSFFFENDKLHWHSFLVTLFVNLCFCYQLKDRQQTLWVSYGSYTVEGK